MVSETYLRTMNAMMEMIEVMKLTPGFNHEALLCMVMQQLVYGDKHQPDEEMNRIAEHVHRCFEAVIWGDHVEVSI